MFRGSVNEIICKIDDNTINQKGEFTIILAISENNKKKSVNETIKQETATLLKKYTLTETVEIVHKLSNISKKDIYKMALKLKDE